MRGHLLEEEGTARVSGLNLTDDDIKRIQRVVITACGERGTLDWSIRDGDAVRLYAGAMPPAPAAVHPASEPELLPCRGDAEDPADRD